MADNHRLLELAKDGDRDARDKLVTDNMGLVVSVARRYVGRGQELEDLIQIGLIGLVKAIDRFDMDYEVKLSTYAVPLIQGEIRRFLRDDGMVKVSRNLKTIYYRADRYRHEVEKNRGTEPGMEEICAAPSNFAFGTELIVDGHTYTVQDRGGAINGNHLDIYFSNHQAALNFATGYYDVYVK